jgi:Arginyl-tRNA synthetase
VVVFFHDDPELADKPLIIRKRDGGFNYATTDVATIDYRVNELKADAIWYVVGAPQTLHFKQIFAVARREGYTTDLRHIIFGSVLGEDRKLMKTRRVRMFLCATFSRKRADAPEKSSTKKIRSE